MSAERRSEALLKFDES